MRFLLPTRECESDLLAPVAQQIFAASPTGHARVQAICDWALERRGRRHRELKCRPRAGLNAQGLMAAAGATLAGSGATASRVTSSR
jgi:hypothetical protein